MSKIKCNRCNCWVALDLERNCSNCGGKLETAAFDLEPAPCPIDVETASHESRLQIRLEYQHTPCFSGQHGSIPLRLINRGRSTITELELISRSNAFSSYSPPPPRKINLPPQGVTTFLPLDFDIVARAGKYSVELQGYYLDEKGNPNAFCGLLFLIVRDPEHKGARVVLKDVHGADLSNLLDMEAIDELQIANSGGIDASQEIRRPSTDAGREGSIDNWLPVDLEEDYQRTRSLNAWLKKQRAPKANPSIEIPSPKQGSTPCRAAILTLNEDGNQRMVHIRTQSRTWLGRTKPPADLLCVRLPMHENNAYISGKHCALEVLNNTVYLQDGPSRNGTFINQRQIDAPTPLQTGQIISLAGQLELDFRAFRQIDHTRQISHIFNTCSSLSDCSRALSQFDLHHASQNAPLECFQLRRRDAYRHRLAYLFVQSAAPIGASKAAALQLDHDSVAPLHARLLYQRQFLFIEDLHSPGGTWVDGMRLKPYSPCPLGAEARIRLGEQQLSYQRLEP